MKKVNREVIIKACEALHIVKGDMVLTSSFFENIRMAGERTEAIAGGFLDVIGNEGTLIIPTFLQKRRSILM